MKKNTLFTKLFLIFIIFSLIIIGLLWLLQTHFLPGFYEESKVKQMAKLGMDLSVIVENDGLADKAKEHIEDILPAINGRITIHDKSGRVLYLQGIMGFHRGVKIPNDLWRQALEGKTVSYKIPGTMGRADALSVMVPFSKGVILIQSPLQSIENTVEVTKQFFVYLFFTALIIAMILAGIFSTTITKPLVKLNKAAKEMSNLNFELQWDDVRNDEIGELGKTLNFLTDKLKKTFAELQLELQKEKNLEKMRKQFVARVSHELQTPIALISGYVEAIQDNIANSEEEKREYFATIEEEINKISCMVKDLLDLSQLESGNFKVRLEVFEITALIQRTVERFRVLAKRDNLVEFSILGDERELNVSADEYRIQQVLVNLIQNAVKNTKVEGKIEITIKDLKDKVLINVFNEGEVIKEDDLEYIWESFYKGQEHKDGIGLGLAIVKNVLELHESNFGVKNQGNGVLFYFELSKYKPTGEI